MTIIALERFVAVTENDRSPSLRAAEFFEELARQVNQNTITSGSGTPEGSVTASPYKMYFDTSANTMYVKKTGEGNIGWVSI